MTLQAVTAEVDRLCAIGNSHNDPARATLAIAKALTAGPGRSHSQTQDPLARHLAQYTDRQVRVTRYEVMVGKDVIPLNAPPGDRLVLREFVCAYDDHPRRFTFLRQPA